MPDGAALAIPSPEERRRAAEIRASRRPIVSLPADQPTMSEPEESSSLKNPGEEAFTRDQELKLLRERETARRGAVLAAGAEPQAARQFETERLAARRVADSKAAVAASAVSERARKEASRRAAQWMMRLTNDLIGDGVLSATIVAPVVSFLIKNIQLFLVNIYNGGESVKIPGLQWIPGGELPRLEWWEVVYVVFLDIVILPLVLLLNPITLPIVIILGAGLFLR